MNEEKISSDDVPQKFTDWLLDMGCPPDKIPSNEKVTQICRGQYYMVWRSLMEHVESKDIVRLKRLQVFCDDIRRYSTAKTSDSSILIPTELLAWRQNKETKQKVTEAERRLQGLQDTLNVAMEKVSKKLAQRNISRRANDDVARRTWLLQNLAAELKHKKENLNQAKGIAESLSHTEVQDDVQKKLNKCIALLKSQQTTSNNLSTTNSLNTTAIQNKELEYEETLSCLANCPSNEVWSQLYENRVSLVEDLVKKTNTTDVCNTSVKSQRIVAETAALHSNLALNAVKHKLQMKQIQKRLEQAVSTLNDVLDNDSCELLVLRCERSRAEAKILALRSLIEDLKLKRGQFSCNDMNIQLVTGKQISVIDKAILTNKEEIEKFICMISKTERKIQNVRESLCNIFKGFQGSFEDTALTSIPLDLSEQKIASLRKFYQNGCSRCADANLSLNFDTSDVSFNDTAIKTEPSFLDELNIYLKKFCLEKNRKLVLNSGEKIWIFETYASSASLFHSTCLTNDVTLPVCPSISVTVNLRSLIDDVTRRCELNKFVQSLDREKREFNYDILSQKQEEEQRIDKIKKKLNENIVVIQKVNKTIDLGRENIKFWSENSLKQFVSNERKIQGNSYCDLEVMYLKSLN